MKKILVSNSKEVLVTDEQFDEIKKNAHPTERATKTLGFEEVLVQALEITGPFVVGYIASKILDRIIEGNENK